MKSKELFLALSLVTATGITSIETVKANEFDLNSDRTDIQIIAQDAEGGAEQSPGEQANADFQDKMSGAELLSELQKGGYVIYFRHAQTEKDYADQVTADVNNCSTQRVLSETGLQQSLTIGEAFEKSQIPIGTVTTSEYCRAWTTAGLAFGEYQKDPALNFLPFEDYTDEQVEEMKVKVMPLLTAMPASGTNDIIVGHDDIFESATGIYPDPQGIAYIVKPDGEGGCELVANMLPEEWMQL